jgi:2-keto-4-pentenoate hydratase
MIERYASALTAQVAAMRARLAEGMPRRGWKVGINVPEIQVKLGLEHSLVGWLDGDRILPSGAMIPLPPGSLYHVEPELCLRLANSVDVDTDLTTARAAVDAIAAALEIVDYAKPAKSLADIIRHSMFHAACVLGEWHAAPEQGTIDIADHVRLHVGARQCEAARKDLVPEDVGQIVVFVARVLAGSGERLLAGDMILSGSFTAKALPLEAGQAASAELGGFGSVDCRALSSRGLAERGSVG